MRRRLFKSITTWPLAYAKSRKKIKSNKIVIKTVVILGEFLFFFIILLPVFFFLSIFYLVR